MSKAADAYVARFEEFLERIGISGKYFCARQHERWIGRVRKAYEQLEQVQDQAKTKNQ